MKHTHILSFYTFSPMKLLLLLFVLVSFSHKILAQCDDLKPMYSDNCVKSAKMKRGDEQFRKVAIRQYGSPDSAMRHYLTLGWKNFQNRNDSSAMKNLNKAWLINPENAETYFA